MKVRVKLGSESQTIVFEQQEPTSITLQQVRESVARQFSLDNQSDIQLSLNRKDALTGENQTLDTFGIVAGDLLHVIGPNIVQQASQPRRANQISNRSQPLVSDSSHRQEIVMNTSTNQDQEPMSSTSATQNEEMDTADKSQVSELPLDNVSEINRFLLEPLVIRESTERQVPVLLTQLFLSANVSRESEALWVAVHTLMLESGFLPSETQDSTLMPNGWKQSGYFVGFYDLLIAANTVGKCSVVGVTLGSSIVLHGLVKPESIFKTEHLQLRSTDFVRKLSTDVPSTYRALDKLSRLFKDTVCLPLINELFTAAGFPERQGLQALPYEAKVRILLFLDAPSLCHLSQTCWEFSSLCKERTIWRRLYIQSFGKPTDSSLSRNWFELFRLKNQQLKDERAARRGRIFVDEMDPPWAIPGAGPLRLVTPSLPFPHILGGDYDLNPDLVSGIPNPLRGLGGGRYSVIPQPIQPLPSPLGGLGVPGYPGMPGHLAMPGRHHAGSRNLTGSPFSSSFSQGHFRL